VQPNVINMFSGCISMIKNTVITFNINLTKNFTSMFSGCVSLAEYVPNYSNQLIE